MPDTFTSEFVFEKKTLVASIVPQSRKDGMYYEVNIKGYPRFYMTWSPLYRYDLVVDKELKLPYDLVLAVSDILEKKLGEEQ